VEIIRRRVDELIKDPENRRIHDSRGIDAIKESLKEFGQQTPIVVDPKGKVVKGNGTLEAASQLGWKEIDTIPTKLRGRKQREYAIADNRTGDLSRWDTEKLVADLQQPDFAVPGFSSADISKMVRLVSEAAGLGGKAIEDEVPEPPANPVTKPGDLWRLGDHRVLCGDCRIAADVSRLLGGVGVNVGFTSPPYASQRKYDESSGFEPVSSDDFVRWFEAVQANVAQHLTPDGSWFVNIKPSCEGGQRLLYVIDLVLAHVREWGWRLVDELAWCRTSTPGYFPNRFKNGWEPVYHFSRNHDLKFRPLNVAQAPKGDVKAALVYDDVMTAGRQSGFTAEGSGGGPGFVKSKNFDQALPSNVINVSGVERNIAHTAAFPVGLPAFFISAFSDSGDVVLDSFIGSGTTLIAAAQIGRRGYGLELSPGYCDVIIERWEKLTGGKAKRGKRRRRRAP